MQKTNSKKGFTLIELLVVVAIIGILASIVLASLNAARAKGSNAAIKAGLSNMRAQAALFYDDNKTYGVSGGVGLTCIVSFDGTTNPDPCDGLFTDPNMLAAMKSVAFTSGDVVVSNTDATGENWAASATLKPTDGGDITFCVDGSGVAKTNVTALSGLCQ